MNNKVKVIAINGPPKSGKDTVANILNQNYTGVIDIKMSAALKSGCHLLLGLDHRPHAFEDLKDVELDAFFGYTPRNFYIRVSENLMKPMMGKETFGYIWLRKYKHETRTDDGFNLAIPEYVTVSDCGFYEELAPLFKYFGAEGIAIIRLHRDQCTFDYDSREEIRFGNPDVKQFDIDNNGSLELLENKIERVMASLGIYPTLGFEQEPVEQCQ